VSAENVWVVLPTYNEAETIADMVPAVLAALGQAAAGRHHVLVVDDASPDGTGAIADRLAAEHPAVEVLHRAAKEGLGPAYLAGFEIALARGADLVVQMDADFSHDPADIPRLIAASRDADLVLGSRYVRGGGVSDWGRLRRLVSSAGGIYARVILGVNVKDLTGGFKCVRREVLERLELSTLRSQGYVFQIEMTYRARRAGFRVVEIPIVFRARRAGKSKMSPRIASEAVWLVPRLRFGSARRAERDAGRAQTGGRFSPDVEEGEATSAEDTESVAGGREVR
jgi:dolichol-phosphate mannosyltransferase